MTHTGFSSDVVSLAGAEVPAATAPLDPRGVAPAEHVATPRHTSQLVRLVQNARRRGVPIAIFGRDRPPASELDGVVLVDLSCWQHVETPHHEQHSIMVEPGASFRQILAKTLPLGLAPKALPLDLDASLGGVLSGVGVGSTSHRHGYLAAQVAYAQVVLGTGDVVHTGPATERDVFDCVLGGAGRFGVITSVELKLEPAPPRLTSSLLSYADCRALVHDLIELGKHPPALQVLAGRRSLWQGQQLSGPSAEAPYCLQVSLAAPAPGDEPTLPEGLEAIGTQPLAPGDLAQLSRSQHALAGSAAAREARWVALLPDTPALPLVLDHVLTTLEPAHACVVTVLTPGDDAPTALASLGTKRVLAVSARPRQLSEPDDGVFAEMGRRVYRAGGRLCPSGWLARRDPAFWRTHYRGAYSRMALLKRLFDPANILCSTAGPLRPAL